MVQEYNEHFLQIDLEPLALFCIQLYICLNNNKKIYIYASLIKLCQVVKDVEPLTATRRTDAWQSLVTVIVLYNSVSPMLKCISMHNLNKKHHAVQAL